MKYKEECAWLKEGWAPKRGHRSHRHSASLATIYFGFACPGLKCSTAIHGTVLGSEILSVATLSRTALCGLLCLNFSVPELRALCAPISAVSGQRIPASGWTQLSAVIAQLCTLRQHPNLGSSLSWQPDSSSITTCLFLPKGSPANTFLSCLCPC